MQKGCSFCIIHRVRTINKLKNVKAEKHACQFQSAFVCFPQNEPYSIFVVVVDFIAQGTLLNIL